jgi:hypothetical protein
MRDRSELRRALRSRYPWLDDDAFGPRAVDAGECDGCATEARLVTTCGPGTVALGRRCAAAAGADAWCDGHADEAAAALAWLARLPAEADAVARLWWVATGEVSLDPDILQALARRCVPCWTG